VNSLEETLRSRAARLSARRNQGLVSRGLAKRSAELRAFVEADQLTMLLRASARRQVTPASTTGSLPTRYESPGDPGNIGEA
jgi:hypothetical protein